MFDVLEKGDEFVVELAGGFLSEYFVGVDVLQVGVDVLQ